MAGPGTSHEFIRYIDIEERVSAAAYTGDAGTDYIMSEDGVIHKITGKSDNTNPIPAAWQSKKLDYSDRYPEFKNYWKTLDQVQIKYEDIDADTPVTVYISDDGGVSWDSKTLTLGTGDGKVKLADYFWADSEKSTARFHEVKVECSSASHSFELHGIMLYLYIHGEYFGIS